MPKKFAGYTWILSCLLAGFSGQTHAAAFQLLEQNVSNLGTAYSGTAALAEDASTAFYNAAGLTHIKNHSFTQSLVLVNADLDLTISTSLSNLGTASDGAMRDNPGGAAAIPAFHYAARLNDKIVVAVSLAPPFGTKTDYSKEKAARYAATTSEVQVLDLSPSIAYQWDNQWSFGVGADIEHVKAKLNARVGSGTRADDGYQKNTATDWGYGWHAGVLYDLDEHARVGLAYRSMVRFEARGNSKSLLGNLSQIQQVTAAVDLPESLTLSGYYDLDNKWALMADLQWTRWNRFDVLELEYAGVHTGSGVRTVNVTETPMHFKNSVRTSLGANYQLDERWLLRAGIARDPTPVQDEYRTARIPDATRHWVALGARYQWSPTLTMDFGYAHLFIDSVTVDDSGPISANSGLDVTAVNMAGNYDSQADLLGVQINWDFL